MAMSWHVSIQAMPFHGNVAPPLVQQVSRGAAAPSSRLASLLNGPRSLTRDQQQSQSQSSKGVAAALCCCWRSPGRANRAACSVIGQH
eukprot:1152357-Pelagomonas_calceolata.AAC.2